VEIAVLPEYTTCGVGASLDRGLTPLVTGLGLCYLPDMEDLAKILKLFDLRLLLNSDYRSIKDFLSVFDPLLASMLT